MGKRNPRQEKRDKHQQQPDDLVEEWLIKPVFYQVWDRSIQLFHMLS